MVGKTISISKVLRPEPEPASEPEPVPKGSAGTASRNPYLASRVYSGIQLTAQALLATKQKMLCGPLWFEGEICILFADTNVGKSILAVQIADMIARGNGGEDYALPELQPECEGQKVVYADFELTIQQFARRYTVDTGLGVPDTYRFSDNMLRLELDYGNLEETQLDMPMYQLIFKDLERAVQETGAKVLIVDNITFMATGTETASDAMPLMKRLVGMKKQYGLSILLLAHTPKRCLSNPLTRNDLQGSKMLINFADSAFAIGESAMGSDTRYIKQIKQRNCEPVYDAGNVLVCRIAKEGTFLRFGSAGTGSEEHHLCDRSAAGRRHTDREEVKAVLNLKAQGLSYSEIAERLSVSRSKVYRLAKDAED